MYKMKGFNKKTILFLAFLGIFCITSTVLALQVTWPPSPVGTNLTDESQLPDMVKYFYEWGIALGGLAAFISLVMAGFQYLTSVGRPEVMGEAMDRIRSALFGLVLLLSSWLILNIINPRLTTFYVSFNPPDAPPGATKTCQTDTECGELKCMEYAYEENKAKLVPCKGGNCYCVPDPNPTPCEKVILNHRTTILASDDCTNLWYYGDVLTPGNTYSSEGYPTGCSGTLYLYQREKCETLASTVNATQQNITVDKAILSVRLVVPQETQ